MFALICSACDSFNNLKNALVLVFPLFFVF